MSVAEIIRQINKLPPQERLEVAQAAWSSLVDDNEFEIPLTEAQRRLLRERLEEARAHPEAGRPLQDVVDDLERTLGCEPLIVSPSAEADMVEVAGTPSRCE